MKKLNYKNLLLVAVVLVISCSFIDKNANTDNAGLTLPSGFSATSIASNLGRARHIAINKNGEIY